MTLIGEVPGVRPGTLFVNRAHVRDAGIHRPLIAGICGTWKTGAESIVLNGGYIDDVDSWSHVIYTGHGGNDPSTKLQVSDQSWDAAGNAALVASERMVSPVRVVRGFKGSSAYSPRSGYRYDGLYQVVRHWEEQGKDGYLICRFALEQVDRGYGPRTG
jgi:putative restriction endonuclease